MDVILLQTEDLPQKNLILRTRVTSGETRGQAKQKQSDSPDWGLTSGAWVWGPGWPLERPESRQSRNRVILLTEAYLRSLSLRTRVTSGEARGQAKHEESDGCHSSWLSTYLRSLILKTRMTYGEARGQASSRRVMGVILPDWVLAYGAWFWGPGWPMKRPEVRQSCRRVTGVILRTEGLPQELDFEDQGELWRGQRSGKAEGEWWVSIYWLRAYLQSLILRTRVTSGEARGQAKQ